MNRFVFELGRNTSLCLAELMCVLGSEKLIAHCDDFAVFGFDSAFDPAFFQDRLGGTIKIMQVVHEFSAGDSRKTLQFEIEKFLDEFLVNYFVNNTGKIPFSINLSGYGNRQVINIRGLLNFSKKILKKIGLNSRFVNKNFKNVPSSTIFKAGVVRKGLDLNFIRVKGSVLVAKTVSIQNIDAYSDRDYGKPVRDTKVGMLPPKLAQMMINLSGENGVVYDPFCGTGTVLIEGMLMGKVVIGSDLSGDMVKATETNCEWLKKKKDLNSDFFVFQKDARLVTRESVSGFLGGAMVGAVVTEGYLGPLLEREPRADEVDKVFRELSNLHLNWLRAVGTLLKKNSRIVMCVTAYKLGNRVLHLSDFDEIASFAGFKVDQVYTYGRPNQVVMRDIKVLVKR